MAAALADGPLDAPDRCASQAKGMANRRLLEGPPCRPPRQPGSPWLEDVVTNGAGLRSRRWIKLRQAGYVVRGWSRSWIRQEGGLAG